MPPTSQSNDSHRIESGKARATIALIGATSTAEQIASRALVAGLNVIIDDVSDTRLQAISTNLQNVVRAQHRCAPGPLDQSVSAQSDFSSPADPSSSSLSTLLLTQSIDRAIRSGDFLIDTLPDDLEVKLELFTLFDKFAKPTAIFITTGSIPIDDLAAITFCPDRCLAVRLTLAPNNTEFSLQLIAGEQTSTQTLAKCTDLFLHSLAFRAK